MLVISCTNINEKKLLIHQKIKMGSILAMPHVVTYMSTSIKVLRAPPLVCILLACSKKFFMCSLANFLTSALNIRCILLVALMIWVLSNQLFACHLSRGTMYWLMSVRYCPFSGRLAWSFSSTWCSCRCRFVSQLVRTLVLRELRALFLMLWVPYI